MFTFPQDQPVLHLDAMWNSLHDKWTIINLAAVWPMEWDAENSLIPFRRRSQPFVTLSSPYPHTLSLRSSEIYICLSKHIAPKLIQSIAHSFIHFGLNHVLLSLYVFNLTHELHIDVTRLDEYTLHALHELRLADERVSRAREDEEANSSAEEEENDRKEEDKTKQQFPLHFKWVNKREADA